MTLSFNRALCSLAFAIAALAATYLAFGFYYEEYEALFDGMISGRFSPGTPFDSWYYMGHIGLASVYSWLYNHFSNFEWISWILYGYLCLAAALMFFLVRRLLEGKVSSPLLLLIQVILFVLIVADNALNLHYTRVSCFVCGASLLAIVILFDSTQKIRQHPFAFAGLLLFFFIGALTRWEPAIGTVALFFFFALAATGKWWHSVKLFILPGVMCLGIVAWMYYDEAHTTDFYKLIEPDVEYQVIRGNLIPLSTMKNANDSLKYEAAKNMLWADPSVISVPYLRSLIRKDNPMLTDPLQWYRSKRDLGVLIDKYKYLGLFNILLLFAVLFRRRFVPPRNRWYWLLYNFAFWVLTFLQVYFIKTNDRSFFPYICMYTFGNILLWMVYEKGGSKKWPLAGFTLLIIAAAFQLSFTMEDAKISHRDKSELVANMNTLKKAAGGQILLVNNSSYRSLFLCNEPFKPFDASAFYRVYANDLQVLSLTHPYREFLEKECNCNVADFSSFYKYLLHINKEVFVLSNEERVDLEKRCLLHFHGLDVRFEEMKDVHLNTIYTDERGGDLHLKLYRLIRNQ